LLAAVFTDTMEPMFRPLYLDLSDMLVPLLVGTAALACGRLLRRASVLVFRSAIVAAILAVATLGVGYFTAAREPLGDLLWYIGGESTVACVAALFLLGVVLSSSRRSSSTGFLHTLAGLTLLILVLHSSGRLWWRFVSELSWRNAPDSGGALTQTTGWTCSPAAAVMLLHHHGVATTEGEMAYLARTSCFGTDARSIGWALSRKAAPQYVARLERSNYASCIGTGPCLACIHLPGLGGHAVFILRAGDDNVDLIDPRFGQRQKVPRATIEAQWDNAVVYLAKAE
jgi:hypothetical protein